MKNCEDKGGIETFKCYCHFQTTGELDQEETQTNQACKENFTAEHRKFKFQKPQSNKRQYASIPDKQIQTHTHTMGFLVLWWFYIDIYTVQTLYSIH